MSGPSHHDRPPAATCNVSAISARLTPHLRSGRQSPRSGGPMSGSDAGFEPDWGDDDAEQLPAVAGGTSNDASGVAGGSSDHATAVAGSSSEDAPAVAGGSTDEPPAIAGSTAGDASAVADEVVADPPRYDNLAIFGVARSMQLAASLPGNALLASVGAGGLAGWTDAEGESGSRLSGPVASVAGVAKLASVPGPGPCTCSVFEAAFRVPIAGYDKFRIAIVVAEELTNPYLADAMARACAVADAHTILVCGTRASAVADAIVSAGAGNMVDKVHKSHGNVAMYCVPHARGKPHRTAAVISSFVGNRNPRSEAAADRRNKRRRAA